MPGDGVLRGLGRSALSPIEHAAGILALLAATLRASGALARRPVRQVLYRQIYFTGLQALLRTSLIGLLIGIVVLTQVASLVGPNAALGGRILVWTVVRELGPLFAAIVVISRSSSAAAAELASMQVNRELFALRALGIDPVAYLVLPRVVGMTVSLLALTAFFEAVTILGGLAISSLVVQLPFLAQVRGIADALRVFDVAVSFAKCLLFGLVLAAAACYHGLQVRFSVTEVPQATTAAVMQSLFLVVAADVLVTVLFYV